MRRQLVTLAAVAAALGAVAGSALGYWTSGGTGSGSTVTGSMQKVVLAQVTGDSPGTRLLPGSTGEVILRLSNPNTYAVKLVSVVQSGAIAVAGTGGCTAVNAGVTFTDQTGLAIIVPAGSSLVRLPGAAAMSTTSASGCQGATFAVPVTITVQQP